MTKSVNPIPEGYHSITPYFVVKGAAAAIDFYKKAFDAKELMRFPTSNGLVGHAELLIGDSHLMIADGENEVGKQDSNAPVSICLYVNDVDSTANRLVELGAKVLRPVKNQFYGDRAGTFLDPFGCTWTVLTHVEDLTPEEIEARAKSATC